MRHSPNPKLDLGRNACRKSHRKRRNTPKMAILSKKSKNFIKAKLTVSKSWQLGLICFMIFLHFKEQSSFIPKISFNLSVQVAIFLVFHNPFMMLFHILMSISDHELILDNFFITRSVDTTLASTATKVAILF